MNCGDPGHHVLLCPHPERRGGKGCFTCGGPHRNYECRRLNPKFRYKPCYYHQCRVRHSCKEGDHDPWGHAMADCCLLRRRGTQRIPTPPVKGDRPNQEEIRRLDIMPLHHDQGQEYVKNPGERMARPTRAPVA